MRGEVVSTSFVNGHDLLEWMGVLSGGEFCGGVVQPKGCRSDYCPIGLAEYCQREVWVDLQAGNKERAFFVDGSRQKRGALARTHANTSERPREAKPGEVPGRASAHHSEVSLQQKRAVVSIEHMIRGFERGAWDLQG
jgi:hypothetical protein